jgi:Acetyltransferase (GNAT) domain/Acetyltransferase (GNAT) family
VNELRIRVMRPEEIAIAADWAAAEGWNPGLADAACFATVDREGFLIGELDGAPAATVSCVNYDARFAFLGFYIVRGDLRGRGYGLRMWNAAIAHAGARVIGLDGVVAQQENYKKSGFALAYANVRYGGTVAAPARTIESPRWPLASLASAARADEPGSGRVSGARTIESPRWPLASLASAAAAPPAGVVPLSEVPFAAVEADDATVFPAPRTAFLRAWIGAPGHVGRALLRDGKLTAWGVIRPCRRGCKIGPLIADDRAAAEAVLAALLAGAVGGEVFLDVPGVNREAVALAESLGLAPVFETARMYSGAIRPVRLERVFGVTTFELG